MANDIRLKYVESLMRKNYEAVGFLPMSVAERYLTANQLWLQYENNEPCGYLIFGNGHPTCRVFQCCIQTDARRQHGATQLINALIQKTELEGYSAISLRCADDLESNKFWEAIGFVFVGQSQGGKARGRKINHWLLRLHNSTQSNFFDLLGLPEKQKIGEEQ
jgi:hypothetical protein